MEYLEQGSLDAFIEERSPIDLEQCLQLFEDIAIGMFRARERHTSLRSKASQYPAGSREIPTGHFGQSRLSTDQSPALGTLFYMWPEQADLTAVPDIRWDVYGLGAIYFYSDRSVSTSPATATA